MRLARRPRAVFVVVLQLLVAMLLWTDAFELHAGVGGHDGLAESGSVAPAATHPAEPNHLEPSPELAGPRCPACALQLQGVGCAPPVGRPLGRLAAATFARPGFGLRPTTEALPVRGGRAPPLA